MGENKRAGHNSGLSSVPRRPNFVRVMDKHSPITGTLLIKVAGRLDGILILFLFFLPPFLYPIHCFPFHASPYCERK